MMNTVENQPPPASADDDLYHSDDVGLRDTPPLRPMKVNLTPSPSPPPAVPLPQVSPDSSPDSSPGPPNRKGSNRSKNRPSQGDAVLVSFMDGGKRPDIARQAGHEPLASDGEEDEGSMKGTQINLAAIAIAAGALANVDQSIADGLAQGAAQGISISNGDAPGTVAASNGGGDPMDDVKLTIPSITATLIGDARDRLSPETAVKSEIKTVPDGELPPIRTHSPKSSLSNGTSSSSITLPSISAQLGDINHLGETVTPGDAFSQSPPARPLPRFPAIGHGSPPKSPSDVFRRDLPSPARAGGHFYYNSNNHQRPSQADTPYTSAADYSSSNTETPSTDQSASTPAMAIDRMSIDGITNPQIGGFQCNYPSCTAQPFQTQYLLNSHANVHSSNRPHYCSVKGCPRSEGGKGFKRKNEMIRHGLVHDSPGYVCPFCPDREHKYPRPDNLQRHVRVHHVDKDKDDPQLREVLSQRPEGPSRGRRRRGGTA